MNWTEELPRGCPPSKAETAAPEQVFYRMTRNDPPIEEDFYSQAKAQTRRAMSRDVDECIKRGVSLFDDLDTITNKLHLPRTGKYVVELTLNPSDGVVLEGSNHHWTWWKTDSFSINRCKKVL